MQNRNFRVIEGTRAEGTPKLFRLGYIGPEPEKFIPWMTSGYWRLRLGPEPDKFNLPIYRIRNKGTAVADLSVWTSLITTPVFSSCRKGVRETRQICCAVREKDPVTGRLGQTIQFKTTIDSRPLTLRYSIMGIDSAR